MCYHKMGEPIRKCNIIRRSIQPFMKVHSYWSSELRCVPFLLSLVFASCRGPGETVRINILPMSFSQSPGAKVKKSELSDRPSSFFTYI